VLDDDVVAEEPRWLAAGAGDQGLGRVEFQSEGLPEEPREPGLDLLGFGLRPGESQYVIIRLCRLLDYADRAVNVLAGALVLAAGAA
jgi:hypothetical protein